MTRKQLDNESIRTLCKMNRSAFYAIREEAELRLKRYFHSSKIEEIKLDNPVYCSFWNRGLDIKVDRVFIENNTVFVGGKTCNEGDTTEIFNNIFSDISLDQLFEQIHIY